MGGESRGFSCGSLLIGETEDGEIKVSAPKDSRYQAIREEKIGNDDRLEADMNGMKGFNQGSETWFQLYQMAQEFRVDVNNDQFIFIPYVREAET